MKGLILSLVMGLALLTGCARHYVIRLYNGMSYTTVGKPRSDGANYVFKDLTGTLRSVSKGSVREIGPASMEQEPTPFKPR